MSDTRCVVDCRYCRRFVSLRPMVNSVWCNPIKGGKRQEGFPMMLYGRPHDCEPRLRFTGWLRSKLGLSITTPERSTP